MTTICENCVHDGEDPSNSFIRFNIQLNGLPSDSGTFYVHFFEWEFNSIWGKEVDEENDCDSGCSKVKGFSVPHASEKQVLEDYNFQDAFRGSSPTNINVLFTTAYYQNVLEESELAGYRVHVISVDKGSTVNMRNAMKGGEQNTDMEFALQFKMTLSSNVYQIRVIMLKNIMEVLAEIMGFLAGMSFVARFTKQILLNHGIWSQYDSLMEERLLRKKSIRSGGAGGMDSFKIGSGQVSLNNSPRSSKNK